MLNMSLIEQWLNCWALSRTLLQPVMGLMVYEDLCGLSLELPKSGYSKMNYWSFHHRRDIVRDKLHTHTGICDFDLGVIT